MIKVFINRNKDNYVESLTVSGHANYEEYGKDIVCAGVSSVTIGGLNALIKFNKEKITSSLKEGYTFIKVEDKSDEKLQLILETIIVQLQSIEESYPQFVKIIKQGG